jgi:hypothetical protein
VKHLWLGALLLATAAQAFDNGQYEGVDPAIREWFKNVTPYPGGIPCCSLADGHLTEWRAGKATQYEVPIVVDGADGLPSQVTWVPVPDNVVIHVPNPTGSSVVWYGPTNTIRCFVPAFDT